MLAVSIVSPSYGQGEIEPMFQIHYACYIQQQTPRHKKDIAKYVHTHCTHTPQLELHIHII